MIKKKKKVKMNNFDKAISGILIAFVAFILIAFCFIRGEVNKDEILASKNNITHTKGGFGKVKITEYADMECPACAYHHVELTKFLKENPKVSLEFKHFPLSMHTRSVDMAKYSIAISKIDKKKFWIFLDIIYAEQSLWSRKSNKVFEKYIKDVITVNINMDFDMVMEHYNSEEIKAKVLSDLHDAKIIKAKGTPTFLINGKKIKTPNLSKTSWKEIIESAKET